MSGRRGTAKKKKKKKKNDNRQVCAERLREEDTCVKNIKTKHTVKRRLQALGWID